MRCTRAAAALVVAVLLAWTVACLDSSGPVSALDTLPGLLVSQPVDAPPTALGSVRTLGDGAPAAGHVVYVSLVPGTVSTGLEATIRDQTTGASITTTIVAGGFDPVPVAAEVDDTLQVEITRTGDGPLKGADLVKPIRPPTIVRTSPPKGGHDVPLNAVIVVVFSEPIDSATLTTGTLQLWRDATAVAGTVRFADAAHLRFEFHPDSLLAPQTEYRLVATQAIHDINGTALDSSLDVPFTTGTTAPASGLAFASLSVGSYHTCGVTTDGKAYCWGSNAQGQLGDGTERYSSATPVLVSGALTFASLSAGYDATCGVTTDGAAYCWGEGGLGVDSVTVANNCSPDLLRCPTPLAVAGGHTFKMVSVGVGHTCGVTTDSAAYCWGAEDYGKLGVDSTTLIGNCRDESPGNGLWVCGAPLLVAGGLTFATVGTGQHHTCGLTTDGATYCWGANAAGQLGTGTTTGPELCSVLGSTYPCSHVPVAVTGGLTFTEISAGYEFTCGVVQTGVASCWGANEGGELGNGSTTGPQTCGSMPCSTSPVLVTGGFLFKMLSAGWGVPCGVTTDGAAYCWGWRNPGASAVPLPVSGGLVFASVSSVLLHACGLTQGGVAYCWGGNPEGELGDGTFTDSRGVPVKVAGQP